MPARLIYNGKDTFELAAPIVIVGRRPGGVTLSHPQLVPHGAGDSGELVLDDKQLIVISDLRLARNHFEIRCEGDPAGPAGTLRYFVRDLESHCGTSINGLRVDAGWHQITDGDRLLFEIFELRIEL